MGRDQTREESLELIREMPLTVSVDDIPITTAMRTPGFEEAQAAGGCLGDGILQSREDLLGFSDDTNLASGHIQIQASPLARARATALVQERGRPTPFPSGADDKEVAKVLCGTLKPFPSMTPLIDREKAHSVAQSMRKRQDIHRITRSAHASFVYDKDLNPMSSAEDVGRHNALDKALGMVFLDGQIDRADVIMLSCRMNKDVVRKCANAGISIVVSISRPTTTAVHMARQLNMTLALSTKDAGVFAFSGHQRLG